MYASQIFHKITPSLIVSVATILASTQCARAQAGNLDPTFGNGGIVTTGIRGPGVHPGGWVERIREIM